MTHCFALILAAGVGTRMKGAIPKQYRLIDNKPLLFYTLRAFDHIPAIDQIVLIIAPNDPYFDTFNWSAFQSLMVLKVGGETRQESLIKGITRLSAIKAIEKNDWLITHDGVRCCLESRAIAGFIAQIKNDPVGGILGVPVTDTIKTAAADKRILKTIDRKHIWLAQTPQMFRAHLLIKALKAPQSFSDEACAIEALGYQPLLIEGKRSNIKVTYESDLSVVSAFFNIGC